MKKYHLIIIAAILIFVFYSVIKSCNSTNLLERDGIKTTGKIVDFKHNHGSAYTYYYEYNVEGKVYKSQKASSYFECQGENSGCLELEFVVIYSKSKPEISDIDLGSNNSKKRGNLYF